MARIDRSIASAHRLILGQNPSTTARLQLLGLEHPLSNLNQRPTSFDAAFSDADVQRRRGMGQYPRWRSDALPRRVSHPTLCEFFLRTIRRSMSERYVHSGKFLVRGGTHPCINFPQFHYR